MKLIAAVLASAAIQQPASQIPSVSSALNDYNLSFDEAETAMVFARSEAEFRKARIFVAQKATHGWNAPAPINFSDGRFSDSDPWLTPDGRTLYFISDRPAANREPARTDYDIWRSTRTAEGWSEPEHLGPEVNSKGQELGPELHEGVLYFSSARKGGAGGLDIYYAPVAGPAFERAKLLDSPFNTAASESDFTLSSDGSTAMFWRSVGEVGTIHIARREEGGWSRPVPLPAEINLGPFNFTPSFSSDGKRVRFASTKTRDGQPPGLADVYEAPLPSP